MNFSFNQGKSVYAPRCVSGTNIMQFYKITSFDDLERGYFGIREPKEHCEEIKELQNQICLVRHFHMTAADSDSDSAKDFMIASYQNFAGFV